MSSELKLISHNLCPYVQRAVIALTEKGVSFQRIDIDLADKPEWFLKISPLGKTPVLQVGDTAVFESSAILEYLEETQTHPLHPKDALQRAEHRGWIEFSSSVLANIWGLETAPDEAILIAKAAEIEIKFARLEPRLVGAPWFDGPQFSLVDAVFAPAFRYFDVFDQIGDFGILKDKPKIVAWRQQLARRPSVVNAVGADYNDLLRAFMRRHNAWLSSLESQQIV